MGHDRRGQDLGQEGGGDDQPDDGGIHAAAGEPQGQERDADALQAVIQEVEPVQRDGALSGVGIAAHSDGVNLAETKARSILLPGAGATRAAGPFHRWSVRRNRSTAGSATGR
ncbi:hypothetical protein G6F65_021499 [Rhizopus arrhizus]|nr:hypothetical protein G6F65_021499 [Rhizopus arrhizus]